MNIAKERGLTRLRRGLTVFAGLLLLWWLAAQSGIPAFLLPTPSAVAQALWDGRAYLARHTLVTASEIVSGLALGVLLGAALALCMIFSPRLQRWLMPLALTSRAIPVFARAAAGAVVRLRHERQGGDGGAGDLLPGGVGLFDGLRRVNNDYLDLARTMRASRWRSCGACG